MPITRLSQLAMGSLFALATPALMAQEVIELPAEDRILEAEFEEVYRVGSLDGEDWEQFSRVFAVGFGQSGDLHVMDDQGGRIVVVSRGGRVRPRIRANWRRARGVCREYQHGRRIHGAP